MPRILDSIDSPQDLKGLSLKQLQALAQEIREELVGTVTRTGGHLASNLGVVELTLALHRVFDSPRDKILWDVGHQSYVHKLVTGRRERFATLRQYGGLSGFADQDESPHDPFTMGHASTSISAALGMVVARDLAREDHHVVAVIGDGAITGGMAFEALNHAGHLGLRLLVILNDNGMSISPNVGALARLMNRISLNRRYHWAKREAQQVLSHLPLGRLLWRLAQGLKVGVTSLVWPRVFWGQLGFTYIGPIDGHNLAELERTLIRARDTYHRPTLIHVLTTKGKGYPQAEKDALAFHGIPPKNQNPSTAPTYSQVFANTIVELARAEPRLVAITAAMSSGTGVSLMTREFPQRVFDVGICEQHAITFAAGLASRGFIPVVAIYSTFLQRAFDQVLHDMCLQNLPIILAIDRSGIVGDDGKTHQGTFDLSYLLPIPNLIVCAPKDENELQHLLFTATRAGQPIAIRYPRGAGTGIAMEKELQELPIGQGEIVQRGEDLAIIALGAMVAPALEAARLLRQRGIKAAVVNARFAKPLDSELLERMARSTGRVITIEENAITGGFGSAVLRHLHGQGLNGLKVVNMGLPDEFVEQGPPELLKSKYGLDAAGIARRALQAFPELALSTPAPSSARSLRG